MFLSIWARVCVWVASTKDEGALISRQFKEIQIKGAQGEGRKVETRPKIKDLNVEQQKDFEEGKKE